MHRTSTRGATRAQAPHEEAGALESGARLTRETFERRAWARPKSERAELIEGVVHVRGAARVAREAEPSAWLVFWLSTYAAHTRGVRAAAHASVRLGTQTMVQPHALARIETCGASRLSTDDYVEGPPELIAEIGDDPQRAARRRAYQQSAVREHLTWDVETGAVRWDVLRGGAYTPLPVGAGGVIGSETLPGLRLALDGLRAGNASAVLGALREGLGSRAHQAFVEGMGAHAPPS